MKTRFAIISDTLFVLFISFILSIVFLDTFVPYPYTLSYAFCLALIVATLFFIKTKNSNASEKLKRKEKKEYSELMDDLCFFSKAEQNALLEKALKTCNLQYEKKRSVIYLQKENKAIFMKFAFMKVDKVDILKAFNTLNKSEIGYVFAEEFSLEIIEFAERFGGKIKLVNGKSFYKWLKSIDCIPSRKCPLEKEKRKKASLKALLEKNKSKKFAIFGLVLLATSYFSPIKTYYLVSGVIFLCFSLITRAFGSVEDKSAVSV